MIAQKTGADLRELQPETGYPQNYDAVLSQAKEEIQRKRYPALCPIDMDWNAYDVIYLGTPNWWPTAAPPVTVFLREIMPTDKTIILCIAHDGHFAVIAVNLVDEHIDQALAIYSRGVVKNTHRL